MAVPDYESLMLPLLKFISDKNEHTTQELYEHLSQVFNLTQEERTQQLPSGQGNLFENRVGWAKLYVKKAGLLEDPRRGYAKITSQGLRLLEQNPNKINVKLLKQFPEFQKSMAKTKPKGREEGETYGVEEKTPVESIEENYIEIRKTLAQELLTKLRKSSPNFFEKVVLKLLSTMGYGEGKVTGRSSDGGIDGFVHQDKLGLGKIFFQAKRFGENTHVTSPMMRGFLGALEQKGANQGIFVTTSKFPPNPDSACGSSSKDVVWVDGNKLAELLIDYGVGVSLEKTYQLKKIDEDFFLE